MTGQKFGRLTAIRRVENDRFSHSQWECLCDCGNTTIVKTSRLRSSHTRSCGCLAIDLSRERNKKAKSEAAFNSLLAIYKARAKRRGVAFSLNKTFFRQQTQMPCHYCGRLPEMVQNRNHGNGGYVYNGLDRVDPCRGYTKDNVVPCCRYCNRAKNDFTAEEFKDWINQVYKHWAIGR